MLIISPVLIAAAGGGGRAGGGGGGKGRGGGGGGGGGRVVPIPINGGAAHCRNDSRISSYYSWSCFLICNLVYFAFVCLG